MMSPRLLPWTSLLTFTLVVTLMMPEACDARRHSRRSRDEVTSRSYTRPDQRELREGRGTGAERRIPQEPSGGPVSGDGARGKPCKDCIQAPSIKIRVSGGKTARIKQQQLHARGRHRGSRTRSQYREPRPFSGHRTTSSRHRATLPGSLGRRAPGDREDELFRRKHGGRSDKGRERGSRDQTANTRHAASRQPEDNGRSQPLRAADKPETLLSREQKQRELFESMRQRQMEYRRQREEQQQFRRHERQQQRHGKDKDGEKSVESSLSGDPLPQSKKKRKSSRRGKSSSPAASESNGNSPQKENKQKSGRKSSRRKSSSASSAPSPRNYRNLGWASRLMAALTPTDTTEEKTSENGDLTTDSSSERKGAHKKNKNQSETKDTSSSDLLQPATDTNKKTKISPANRRRGGSVGERRRNPSGRRQPNGGSRLRGPDPADKIRGKDVNRDKEEHLGGSRNHRERTNDKERARAHELSEGYYSRQHKMGNERLEQNSGRERGASRENRERNIGEQLGRGRENTERNGEQRKRGRSNGKERNRGHGNRKRKNDEHHSRGLGGKKRNGGKQRGRGHEDNNGKLLSRGREDRERSGGEEPNRRREERERNGGEELSRRREERERSGGEELSRRREDRERSGGEELSRRREDRERSGGEELSRRRENRERSGGEELSRRREERERNGGEELSRRRENRERNSGQELNRRREDRERNGGQGNANKEDKKAAIATEGYDEIYKELVKNRGKGRRRGRGHGRRNGNGRQRGKERRIGARHHFGAERYGAVYSHTDVNDVPRRPAAADRLERRMSNSLQYSSQILMRSIQRVLSALSGAVEGVRMDNDFIFNGTRYTIMMGVRKQLREIAKVNNMVYDTVMKASLLTKDIYMRAHRSLLTGPTTRSLSRPEVNMPSLYDIRRKTYDEEQNANLLLRTVQNIQRGSFRLDARLRQVTEKFQDSFARNDLRTIVFYVNSTARKLSSELTYSTQAAYIKRNNDILYSSRDSLSEARDLLYKAGENLARGAEAYRGNYRVLEDYRRQKGNHVGAPASLRRRIRSADLQNDQRTRRSRMTPAERRRLRPIIDKIKRHATEQERMAIYIESILRPSIMTGKAFIEGGENIAASTLIASLASRLDRDGKKLYSLLDSIRVLIGMKGELVWVTSSSTACWEDDEDGAEGSGCLIEGSGVAEVPDGGEGQEGSGMLPTITDDEDFVFVDEKDEKKPPAKHKLPTSLVEFGKQLSVYVDGVKLRSNDILQRGDQLFTTTEKLSKRWSDLKTRFDMMELAHRSWKQTKKTLQNFTSYQETIHELAKDVNQEISRSNDLIWERMRKAVEIAERRMAEANARKAGDNTDKADTEQPANDDAAVVEAVEKAQTAKSEWRATATQRAVALQSCGQASAQVMRLHSNISHLRQQVNAAKALLQSMQLSISKSGSGYLSIPLSRKIASSPASLLTTSTPVPPELTWVTTVDVSIRTQDTDGPVLLIKGNNSATFSLSVDDRQVSVTVYDAEGYSLQTITSDVTMDEDRWYSVQVTRTGKRVMLRVTPFEGEEEPVDNEATVDSIAYFQPNPVHAYVGGVVDSEPFSVGSDTWRGCLGNLFINAQRVSLFHPTSTGEAPQSCESAVRRNGNSLVFDGIGFLHFPITVMSGRLSVKPVSFHFRSWQSNAALLHMASQRQRFLLRIMLDDGALVFHALTPSGSSILRSTRSDYNDGNFHSLKIPYQRGQPSPVIDGEEGAFTIMRPKQHRLNNMIDGVVAGAFITKSYNFEKSKYRPLIGCLQKIVTGDVPLTPSEAVKSTGVFSGICSSRTLWSQCVSFGVDSTGIDYGALEHSGTILLLFSPEARGPLLVYSREGKFEAQITATDDGLQVTTEEDELSIDKPDDITEQFILLTVKDDGKKVKYSAWDNEVETSYGGFWDASADIDGAHTVQLGLSSDPTSDAQLIGSISHFMIGDRFINLPSYTQPNKLDSCQRPLPDLVMSEVEPEVAASGAEDAEATCSMDIKC